MPLMLLATTLRVLDVRVNASQTLWQGKLSKTILSRLAGPASGQNKSGSARTSVFKKVWPEKIPTGAQSQRRICFAKHFKDRATGASRKLLRTVELTFQASDSSGQKIWLKPCSDSVHPSVTIKIYIYRCKF